MAKKTTKKKQSETDYDRRQVADKIARGQVWEKLWADKRYQRIQAFKDAALRAWNVADAYATRTSGGLVKAAKADARAKRALARMYAFEKSSLRKSGAALLKGWKENACTR